MADSFVADTVDSFQPDSFVADGPSKPKFLGRKLNDEELKQYVKPLPKGAEEPKSNGLLETAKGLWDTTIGGLYNSTKSAVERSAPQPTDSTLTKAAKIGTAAVLGPATWGGIAGAVEGSADQAKQAYNLAGKGRTKEAAGRALGATPLIGPMAAGIADTATGKPEMPPELSTPADAHSSEEYVPPNPARAGGQIGGVLGMAALANPTVRGKIGQAASAVKSGVSKAVESGVEALQDAENPTRTMTRAVKPPNKRVGFQESLNRSMPELKAVEDASGKPIQSVDDLLAAIPAAKKSVWAQLRELGTPDIDLHGVAKQLRATDPEAAGRIVELQRTMKTRTIGIEAAEKRLAQINAELDSYYGKNPAAKKTEATKNPDTAAQANEAAALRDAINTTLDSESGGAIPRELRRRYGALTELQRIAEVRKNVADRQQPNSLSEQIGTVRAAGKALKGIVRLPSDPMGGLGDITEAVGGHMAGKAIKQSQTTDALIARAFRNYKDRPSPLDISGAKPLEPGFGPIGPPNPGQGGVGPSIADLAEAERKSVLGNRPKAHGPLGPPNPGDSALPPELDSPLSFDPYTGRPKTNRFNPYGPTGRR